ncbi:putative leader peptide [Kineococcus sp. SYSU DK002]
MDSAGTSGSTPAARPFFAVQRRHVDLCRTRSAACR